MHGSRRSSGERWVRRALTGCVAAGLGAVLLTGCAQGSGGGGESLTVYSGQHVQTTEALVAAFEKQTGITVNLRSDDEDVLADQIVTEGSHSPADVFYTENSPPLQYLASKGLLAAVDPSTLADTPSRFNSPDGKWVGVSARVSVMIYNTSLLKADQLPSLGHGPGGARSGRARSPSPAPRRTSSPSSRPSPAPTGRLGPCAGSRRSRPTPAATTTRTTRRSPRRSTAARSRSASSTSTTGTASGPRWASRRCTRPSRTFAPRDVGYVVDVSGAGILKSSSHQAAAQRFVAFLTSQQGQQILGHSDSFEYPIASGVTTAQPETPFDQLQPNDITVAELGTGAEAIRLLQEAQLL